MLAIFKREFKNFFRAQRVFFALFLIFWLHSISIFSSNNNICGWCAGFLLSIPCLAACFGVSLINKEFAANKTYKLLFSSPVNMTAIVLGKYFALVAFFLAVSSISVFIIFLIHFCVGASIDAGWLFFWFLNLIFRIMVGAAVVEFISTWSRNSAMLAGVILTGWAVFVFMVGYSLDRGSYVYSKLKIFIEIYRDCFCPENHALRLSCGVIGFKTIIYFISMIVGFLYLTKKFLESKRFVWGENQ